MHRVFDVWMGEKVLGFFQLMLCKREKFFLKESERKEREKKGRKKLSEQGWCLLVIVVSWWAVSKNTDAAV